MYACGHSIVTPLANLATLVVLAHSVCYGVNTASPPDITSEPYHHPLGLDHMLETGPVAHSATTCTFDVVPGSWLTALPPPPPPYTTTTTTTKTQKKRPWVRWCFCCLLGILGCLGLASEEGHLGLFFPAAFQSHRVSTEGNRCDIDSECGLGEVCDQASSMEQNNHGYSATCAPDPAAQPPGGMTGAAAACASDSQCVNGQCENGECENDGGKDLQRMAGAVAVLLAAFCASPKKFCLAACYAIEHSAPPPQSGRERDGNGDGGGGDGGGE